MQVGNCLTHYGKPGNLNGSCFWVKNCLVILTRLFSQLLGDSSDCKDFPLSQNIVDAKINLFHPTKCGQLRVFNEDNIVSGECFKDKTIIVIGDSRARQIGGHLGILFNKTWGVKE